MKPWSVQAVRHSAFASHSAIVTLLLLGFGFGGDRHARNRMFERHYGVDAACKSHL